MTHPDFFAPRMQVHLHSLVWGAHLKKLTEFEGFLEAVDCAQCILIVVNLNKLLRPNGVQVVFF